jgi:hypothetical protein
MKIQVAFVSAVMSCACGAAWAAGPKIVGPLPGYKCMMLNLTGEQFMDPGTHIPFRSQPSDTAEIAGYASAQVAVKEPVHQVNGYVQARFPTGGNVWIKSSSLAPYHSLGDPTARCVPVMMSNGRSGFDYPRG